ncbi:unnamed protein product, partial [Vitis vinifera]|uniref:Uncharacterized protein n=1 Tax=Vitis vinifera TaxID=29760 RepID=D7SV88_VITVI
MGQSLIGERRLHKNVNFQIIHKWCTRHKSQSRINTFHNMSCKLILNLISETRENHGPKCKTHQDTIQLN